MCTAQFYRTLLKGTAVCTHAPGGDVKINKFHCLQSFDPYPHLFRHITFKYVHILVTAKNVNCISNGAFSIFYIYKRKNRHHAVLVTRCSRTVAFALQISRWICQVLLNPTSSGIFRVYLAVQSCRTEPWWEQKVIWHKWGLCFVYPSSSMSTCFYPQPAWKDIFGAVDVFSSPVCRA